MKFPTGDFEPSNHPFQAELLKLGRAHFQKLNSELGPEPSWEIQWDIVTGSYGIRRYFTQKMIPTVPQFIGEVVFFHHHGIQYDVT
jgi:exoribonuclease R